MLVIDLLNAINSIAVPQVPQSRAEPTVPLTKAEMQLAELKEMLEPVIQFYGLRKTHKGQEVQTAVAHLLRQNIWYRKAVKRQQKLLQDFIETTTIPGVDGPKGEEIVPGPTG